MVRKKNNNDITFMPLMDSKHGNRLGWKKICTREGHRPKKVRLQQACKIKKHFIRNFNKTYVTNIIGKQFFNTIAFKFNVPTYFRSREIDFFTRQLLRRLLLNLVVNGLLFPIHKFFQFTEQMTLQSARKLKIYRHVDMARDK